MTEHPDRLLSAYLDDALAAAERDSVRAHLDGCAICRGQLADLHATSQLIGALPQLEPRRSLVPRLERAPVWLRPVRLLGAMGTGLFVFLFIASAVINSGGSLGGGTTTAEQLAAKGQFGAAVNALASDAAKQVATTTSAPAAAPAPAGQPQSSGVARDAASSASPGPSAVARADATGAVTSTQGPPPPYGPPPALFLTIAGLFAIAAVLAHRRLRRA
ncbi:MAG: zf-HC2 domain-containing protein [Chloroflexota bacterium]|nr:zf-HC2 domain-containing protein [Chloroflexota bacterium]